jgi:hypothetical protein
MERINPLKTGTRAFVLAIVAATGLVSPASSQQPQTIRMYAPEPISCGSWTAARSARTARSAEFWVLGVMSGYNWFSPHSRGDVAPGIDAYALLAWIDRYCSEHPLDEISFATFQLIQELERRRSGAPGG